MKKNLIYFYALACCCELDSQIGYDRNVIHDGIYLIKTGNDLQYAIDEPKAIKYKSLSSGPLYASAKCDRVNILMEYVNPIKMRYNISFSNQINPDLKNLISFFDAAQPLFKELGQENNIKASIKVEDVFKTASGSVSNRVLTNENLNVDFFSEELLQLGLLVVYNPDCYYENYNKAATGSELNRIKLAFKNNLDILSNSEVDLATYNKYIRHAVEILINADEASKAKQVYPEYRKARHALDSLRIAQTMRLEELDKFFEANDEIRTISTNNGTRIDSIRAGFVKNTRKYYQKGFKTRIESKFKEIDNLLTKVDELADEFNKGLDYFIGCEKCEMGMKLAEIPIAQEDIKTVSIKIEIYDIKINDDMQLIITLKNDLQGVLNLKSHSNLSIDFATGPLYVSGFSFSKYSTQYTPTTGSLTVVKVKNETMNFAMGTMLNVIIKTDTYPIFPMWQLGFAIGKDTPVAFTGLGFKTVNNISMSVGVLTGWYKELNNLRVGSEIGGEAELIADYRYRNVKSLGGYFGVQYSF